MSEEFALHYAQKRAKERGYGSYRVIYREFVLPSKGVLKFKAYNEIWLVVQISWGVIVKSDYGRYTNWYTQGIVENVHEHGDTIEITNAQKNQATVRFLQVILKTKGDGIDKR